MSTQSYKNHSRWDVTYHLFVLLVLLLNIIAAGLWYGTNRAGHPWSGPWAILVSIVLFLLALKTRLYATTLQDRIIRLEERTRIASIVSPSELAELESLTTPQLVGLRFASNPELPELARRAVRENLTCKQIKEAIKAWRPDNERV